MTQDNINYQHQGMAITLNTIYGNNEVTIDVTLPNGAINSVLLDFKAEYDREELFRVLEIEQEGSWIVGVLPEDRIPYTGNYRVDIHTSKQGFVTLKDIHIGLNEIVQPLNSLTGLVRDILIKVIRALVYGEDYPTENQPSIISSTITQPDAANTTFKQSGEISDLLTQNQPINTNGNQAPKLNEDIVQISAMDTTINQAMAIAQPTSSPSEIETTYPQSPKQLDDFQEAEQEDTEVVQPVADTAAFKTNHNDD